MHRPRTPSPPTPSPPLRPPGACCAGEGKKPHSIAVNPRRVSLAWETRLGDEGRKYEGASALGVG